MQARRLSKRSVLGSKVNTSEDAQDWGMKGARKRVGMGAVIQAGAEKQRVNDKEEVAVEQQRATCDGEQSVPCSLKGTSTNTKSGASTNQYMEKRRIGHTTSEKSTYQANEWKEAEFVKHNPGVKVFECDQNMNGEYTRILEQKCKVVSSSIDVPRARIFEGEADMDKVTAAMVLTSLSTSPLVRCPPMRLTDMNGSWKELGFVPSSTSSSDCWSWNTPSDCSNPSTPPPPLSADSFKYFQPLNHTDDTTEGVEPSSLLFDEPVPRKRKNSMKVMFKCLWKTCEKVLSTSAGIKKHIRTIHLGHNGESDKNEGEEDFYYTEIRLNTDSVSEGLKHLSPFSQSLQSPTSKKGKRKPLFAKTERSNSSLSHSAPITSSFINPDHAYQSTTPVKIPGPKKILPNGNSIGMSWILSPVTFAGTSVSMSSYTEIRDSKLPVQTLLSSPPKTGIGVRKPRGEGKKCRKVYGMENRDKWCTACRWKKACQRFPD
ncbi:zinc finger protein 704 [Xenopus laevis]|uniref:C2H2-type domain-containing protein n=2 Tax=Xenopus laevis TaxID=8355 RepID=A0A974HEC2_XENLA|nr:zinc finger protein 704 [Xenopus laevis]OCT74839.1 hypothetical protein XELAEV_18033826mg [Xenopus laevis]